MVFSCFESIASSSCRCAFVRASVTFFANVLGLFSFPLAFLKVPLRPLGNVRFLPCLSPDLDGVQLFRIHCHAAAVVRLCLHTGTLFCSSRRSKDVTDCSITDCSGNINDISCVVTIKHECPSSIVFCIP